MAEHYGTTDGFDAYCVARNLNATAHTIDEIAAALVVASEWLDSVYRTSFPGLKVGMREQVREWPREGGTDIYGYAISNSTVPVEVENATYEAAHRELESSGILSTDYTPNKYKRATVEGAVSVEYRAFDDAMDAQTQIVIVRQILAPILTGSGSNTSTTLIGRALRA